MSRTIEGGFFFHRDMRHLSPTMLSKGEAPTVMNTIMLSLEVFASHGNCFACHMKWLAQSRPLHITSGFWSSQCWVTLPHRHPVIHNQKHTLFRSWRLQSKHLPPVLTVPQVLYLSKRVYIAVSNTHPPPPPSTLLSLSRQDLQPTKCSNLSHHCEE